MTTGNGTLTASQLFQRLCVLALGVLWIIVQAVSMWWIKSTTSEVDSLRLWANQAKTQWELVKPQMEQDHQLLMNLWTEQTRREAIFTESVALMRELKGVIEQLHARYTALQVDVIRLQSQQPGRR